SKFARHCEGAAMRKWNDESGQVLILTAMTMTLLLGFVGLATDVGQLFHAKRSMQAAVDSAVIAAAITYKAELGAGASDATIQTDMQAAAKAALAENGINVSITNCSTGAVTSPTLAFS